MGSRTVVPLRKELLADPRWEAVERILASRQFRNSERQSAFLSYVAERALTGRIDEISEQQIGVHVFGKPPAYDSATDNVVRSTARQLRQRLAVYYTEDGEGDFIRLTIPVGTYVPAFQERASAGIIADPESAEENPKPTNASTVAVPSTPVPAAPRFSLAGFAVIAAGTLVAATGFAFASGAFGHQPSSFEFFWKAMLPPGQHMLYVPTDSGIVMYQNVTQKNLSLAEYADGSFAAGYGGGQRTTKDTPEFFFGLRRYTSIADMRFFSSLMRVPVLEPSRIDIRFPRDLTTADFKNGPVILTGGPQGNPWVQAFEPGLNFRIETDDNLGIQTVVNKKPLPGENGPWVSRFREPGHDVYSLIAYINNPEKSAPAIVVSGTTMAGIDAAADFLTNPKAFGPVLDKVKGDRDRFGGFEIVLKTESVRSGAISSVVKALRY